MQLDTEYPKCQSHSAVRVIISLLMFPGRDEAEERAMIEEFVVPAVVPVLVDQATQ
jgi:hypothetical protein